MLFVITILGVVNKHFFTFVVIHFYFSDTVHWVTGRASVISYYSAPFPLWQLEGVLSVVFQFDALVDIVTLLLKCE